jgi:hypothetical protein
VRVCMAAAAVVCMRACGAGQDSCGMHVGRCLCPVQCMVRRWPRVHGSCKPASVAQAAAGCCRRTCAACDWCCWLSRPCWTPRARPSGVPSTCTSWAQVHDTPDTQATRVHAQLRPATCSADSPATFGYKLQQLRWCVVQASYKLHHPNTRFARERFFFCSRSGWGVCVPNKSHPPCCMYKLRPATHPPGV